MTLTLHSGVAFFLLSQEQPKPQKDTVTVMTDEKPTFYYAIEDEKTEWSNGSNKGSLGTIAIIVVIVIVAAGAVILFLKKKK